MALTWAGRRQAYILGGAAAAALLLIAGIAFAVVYEAPSCADGKQNQDEAGVDCGGSCAYLCPAGLMEPRVTYVRALSGAGGRTDVVASIENRNRTAEAKDASYRVEVFDAAGALLGAKEGTLDLPAYGSTPLFLAGVVPGVGTAPRAYVSFGEVRFRTARAEETLKVSGVEIVPGERPRVRATVSNGAASAAYERALVATVFAADGSVIAASRTVLRQVPAFGTSEAVFTWAEAFPESAVRAEVALVPLLP
jgi:hypothetical protein